MASQVIILSGGKSERFGGQVPKPFVRLWGKQLGEFLGESLRGNFDTIYWICGPLLRSYDIEGEAIRWWKGGRHYVQFLNYQTRNPVESLFLGIRGLLDRNLLDPSKPIIVLDNDNYYDETLKQVTSEFFSDCSGVILTRSVNESDCNRYGFLHVKDSFVQAVKEKKRGYGETHISLGGYAFVSVQALLDKLATTEKNNILECFFENNTILKIIEATSSYILGTPEDMEQSAKLAPELFGWKRTRVIVDLDNTLVTYPRVHGDYSTVEIRPEIVKWLQDVQANGAHLVLYTARRSETHKGNVGKIISDVGQVTLETIKHSGIVFNEVHFGKPHGDIYLDDRGYNPTHDKWQSLVGDFRTETGAFQDPFEPILYASSETIKKIKTDIIVKEGKKDELRGYIHYLQTIQHFPSVKDAFPSLIKVKETEGNTSLYLEYIQGIEMSVLYAHNVLKKNELQSYLQTLQLCHSIHLDDACWSRQSLENLWIIKTKQRMEAYPDNYSDARVQKILPTLFQKISSYLEDRCASNFQPCIVQGDAWFSNVLLDEKNKVHFIDMRGKTTDNKLTITGDFMYDYAKIGTSIFGMDSAVYDLPYNNNWKPYWDILFVNCPYEYREYLPFCSASLMISSLFKYTHEIREKILSRIEFLLANFM